jgi:hypothetical protein
MTFLDFQGTRCWCDDLTPHIECSGDPRRQPGYLYVGKLHIERVDETGRSTPSAKGYGTLRSTIFIGSRMTWRRLNTASITSRSPLAMRSRRNDVSLCLPPYLLPRRH